MRVRTQGLDLVPMTDNPTVTLLKRLHTVVRVVLIRLPGPTEIVRFVNRHGIRPVRAELQVDIGDVELLSKA